MKSNTLDQKVVPKIKKKLWKAILKANEIIIEWMVHQISW